MKSERCIEFWLSLEASYGEYLRIVNYIEAIGGNWWKWKYYRYRLDFSLGTLTIIIITVKFIKNFVINISLF